MVAESTVKLAVFILYMLLVFAIGVAASRVTKKEPVDFYLAGRKIGTVVLSFTLMATIFSAFFFFGVGAVASGTGFGTYTTIGVESIMFGLLFATIGVKVSKIGKKFDVVTPSEYLEERFEDSVVPIIYLIVSALFLAAFVTTQIIGGAVALEVLLNIQFEIGAILIALFMAVYIHISGMRGVIWSDTLQGSMMVIVLALIFVFTVVTIGPGELAQGVSNANPELLTYDGPGVWTPLYGMTYITFLYLGVMGYPQVYQRFLGAENSTVLRRSAILFPVIGTVAFFAAIPLAVWSVGIIPDPSNPDYVIPLVIDSLTHPIVTGVVLSAGIAALMSTADSVLLSISSMISRDGYVKYVNPDASEEQEVNVTQWVLIVLIAGALGIALVRPAGIFQLGNLAVAGHAVALPALYLSLYWSGATSKGAISSMIVGGIIMIGFFTNTFPGGSQPMGIYFGFVGLIVSFVTFIVVSWVTDIPADVSVRDFLEA